MRHAIIEIRRKTIGLWRAAQANPVKALTLIGAVSLLAYVVFALLPLALPETDRSDRKSTRLNSSHIPLPRMPSSA